MKKIMFNDRYGLTQAVIEGRKTMTRRIIIPQPDFLSDNFGWAKRNNGDVILPKYGVDEIVAVAQRYSTIAAGHPDVDTFLFQVAKAHKISLESVQDLAGWNNKMFAKAELMPHQIRITRIKCERLQDISEYEQLEAFIEKDEWIGDPVLVRKEELLTEMSSRVRNYDGRRGGANYLRAISQDIDVLLDFMG